MTSINNNIPTRTFVPTITQQPTNTNTTASAGGASATGSSVPTPTSSLVYTASAPKTSNPDRRDKLADLKEEIVFADCEVDYWSREIYINEREMTECRNMLRKIQELHSQDELTDDAYYALVGPIYDKMTELDQLLESNKRTLQSSKNYLSRLKAEYERLLSQEPNLGAMTPNPPTVTGYSPTGPGGAPTVTTGWVPMYPTAS